MSDQVGNQNVGFLMTRLINLMHFRDRNKEKQRQELLMNGEAKKRKPLKRPPKSEAWSHKKERKEKKKRRKEIKEKKRKVEMTEDDMKELDDDFRMVKKLKKNKVSKEQGPVVQSIVSLTTSIC